MSAIRAVETDRGIMSNLKLEVKSLGVQDLVVLFRRLGFASAAAYFYQRIYTGGGVL
jgi:hypothetical protein